MILLMVLVAAVIVTAGWQRHWGWVHRVERWARPFTRRAWAWIRTAPVTYIYLAQISFTTWLLLKTDDAVRDAFLSTQSTNLHELTKNPLAVLARSAFYLSLPELILWWVAFSLILAPMERWMGQARWLLGFWTGHIIASVLVAVGVAASFESLHLDPSIEFAVDTGASYGFAAMLALATYYFRDVGRWYWALGFFALWAVPAAVWPNTTNIGHLTAYCVGLACYPYVRKLEPRLPVFRPWAERVIEPDAQSTDVLDDDWPAAPDARSI